MGASAPSLGNVGFLHWLLIMILGGRYLPILQKVKPRHWPKAAQLVCEEAGLVRSPQRSDDSLGYQPDFLHWAHLWGPEPLSCHLSL